MSQSDPNENAKKIFISRNNISPIMTQGINYDIPSLNQSIIPHIIDGIRKDIIAQYGGNKFIIYDACGYIGSSSISFLASDKIYLVITYESDSKYVTMLRNNINAYKLGFKSLVFNRAWNASPTIGSTVFFHPQWTHGRIKVNNIDLERYLEEYKNSVYLIVFYLPSNYMLDSTANISTANIWDIKIDNQPNYSIHYYVNKRLDNNIVISNSGGYLPYYTKDISDYTTDKWDSSFYVNKIPLIPEIKDVPVGLPTPPLQVISTLTQSSQSQQFKPVISQSQTLSLTQGPQFRPPASQFKPFVPQTQLSTSQSKPFVPQTQTLPVAQGSQIQLPTSQSQFRPSTSVVRPPSSQFTLTQTASNLIGNIPRSGSIAPSRLPVDQPYQVNPTSSFNVGKIILPKSLPTPLREGSGVMAITKRNTQSKGRGIDILAGELPKYSRIGNTPDDIFKNWLTQLQAFIYYILEAFVPDKDIRLKLVSAQAMNTWAKAFTHETFDSDFNYESLEIMGDAILQLGFRTILMKRFPGITSSQISNYETYYMAKVYQAQLSRKIGFQQWLRTASDLSITIDEDIFESFFGALGAIGDDINPGMGSVLTLGFLTFIFMDFNFDVMRSLGVPKTFIQQTVKRLYPEVKDPLTISTTDSTSSGKKTYITTISFTDAILDQMNKILTANNRNPLPHIIGKGVEKSLKGSVKQAYEIAYKTMFDHGFTLEFVDKLKSDLDLSNEDSKLVEAAKTKALSLYGSDNIAFFTPRSSATKNNVTVQLRVILPNGKRKILSSRNSNTGITESIKKNMTTELLRDFVKLQ